MKTLHIKLGDHVRDKVSGCEGIVNCLLFYLNGCVRVEVQPKKKSKDTKPPDSFYMDDQQLELVKNKKALKLTTTNTGGFKPNPPKY